MSLLVGGRQVERMQGEDWAAFKSSVGVACEDEPIVAGLISRGTTD